MGWSDDGKFSVAKDENLYERCGAIDFAGSGIVHQTGGVAALIMLNFIQPREHRFAKAGSEEAKAFKRPDNAGAIFNTLGGFILWFGWYGFNGASTLSLSGNGGLAAHAVMNTTLAASVGCLTSTILYRVYKYHSCFTVFDVNRADVDTSYSVNGIVAGLVSITASCAVVDHWAAVVIGFVGSLSAFITSRVLINFHIDDVVDAVAVHCVPGIWGLWSAGLFATEYHYRLSVDPDDKRRARRCCGVFTCGRYRSFRAAVVFSLVIIAWVTAVLLPVFYFLNKANLIVEKSADEPISPRPSDPDGRPRNCVAEILNNLRRCICKRRPQSAPEFETKLSDLTRQDNDDDDDSMEEDDVVVNDQPSNGQQPTPEESPE
mmetsp:Transcript_27010/g.82898  ORF Transcript_27010/g.82898 Transcript_27010/m.82898 type:complete len:375 (-) Transcript_27010:1157-2281(-)